MQLSVVQHAQICPLTLATEYFRRPPHLGQVISPVMPLFPLVASRMLLLASKIRTIDEGILSLLKILSIALD